MRSQILFVPIALGIAGCVSTAKTDSPSAPMPSVASITSLDYARELVGMIHTTADSEQRAPAASLFAALNGRTPLSPARLREEIAQVYIQRFTEHQLRDLVTFFKTPTGQSFWRTQPEIFALQIGIPFPQTNRK